MNDIARRERVVAAHQPVAHDGAVAAIEITKRPTSLGLKELRMAAAAAFVLDDDLVRGRAAYGHGLARDETKHVCPFRAFPDYQICQH